jgi:hypothetical protein
MSEADGETSSMSEAAGDPTPSTDEPGVDGLHAASAAPIATMSRSRFNTGCLLVGWSGGRGGVQDRGADLQTVCRGARQARYPRRTGACSRVATAE